MTNPSRTTDPILVESDFEPDDLLAIYILLRRGYSIARFVVGEGNARIKLLRMQRYWEMLRKEFPDQISKTCAVTLGLSSKKPFHQDGRDVFVEEVEFQEMTRLANDSRDGELAKTEPEQVLASYQSMLTEYLASHEHPTLVLLKPMRELLVTWPSIPEELRKKTKLVMYGSFNFRCLLDKQDAIGSANRVMDMVHAFGECVLYESFKATGDKNSITASNMPKLYASLKHEPSDFVQCLLRLIRVWNDHCLEWAKSSVRKFDDKPHPLNEQELAARQRSERIVRDIQTSLDSQMVLADSGLALMFENPLFEAYRVSAKIFLDTATGYTQHDVLSPGSTQTSLFLNVPFDSLDTSFLRALEPWTADKIRRTFLDYFTTCGHAFVPESSLVPPNDDKTILFTNSGMNQFKSIFLGQRDAGVNDRACNSQTCVRAGGKHNDFDDVGRDTYHHSSFEMLGNWSFNGAYGKKVAVGYAWDLLVNVYGLDPQRLYVTYFDGGAQSAVPADLEARDIWSEYLPSTRILPFGTKENLWSMADEGPCGPCTEIHYDLIGGGRDVSDLVNRDDPTVIELWNLVFMQYNRTKEGVYSPLPKLHVDTGMGFERLCCALQGKMSNYDTDVFRPLFELIGQCVRVPYNKNDEMVTRSYHIVADHMRSLISILHDDITPSAVGRGFVVQKLFNRACFFGQNYLKAESSFMTNLAEKFLKFMAQSGHTLRSETFRDRQNLIQYVIQGETQRFGKVIWKSVLVFDLIRKRESNQITQDDQLLLRSRGVPEFAVQQFAVDHGLAVLK